MHTLHYCVLTGHVRKCVRDNNTNSDSDRSHISFCAVMRITSAMLIILGEPERA